jgi:hypothetical protein
LVERHNDLRTIEVSESRMLWKRVRTFHGLQSVVLPSHIVFRS